MAPINDTDLLALQRGAQLHQLTAAQFKAYASPLASQAGMGLVQFASAADLAAGRADRVVSAADLLAASGLQSLSATAPLVTTAGDNPNLSIDMRSAPALP